ncbi:hypothetical protein ACJJI4_18735 [Microbulbifer sp. TRSA002]|uniref:Imm32 family immunity protein n=1 Tax=unclassified Microbulbifer TaxID=2619833 RepID=UPI004039A780
MKELEFTHKFFLNKSGIPFSEKEHTGVIELDVSNKTVYLSGDKSGLLALAEKLIEVAHCDTQSYHKHLDDVELPNVSLKPDNLEIIIGRSGS